MPNICSQTVYNDGGPQAYELVASEGLLKLDSHVHYRFYAYQQRTQHDDGVFHFLNSVSINVIASSYEEAVKKAMDLVPHGVNGRPNNGTDAGLYLFELYEHADSVCTS